MRVTGWKPWPTNTGWAPKLLATRLHVSHPWCLGEVKKSRTIKPRHTKRTLYSSWNGSFMVFSISWKYVKVNLYKSPIIFPVQIWIFSSGRHQCLGARKGHGVRHNFHTKPLMNHCKSQLDHWLQTGSAESLCNHQHMLGLNVQFYSHESWKQFGRRNSPTRHHTICLKYKSKPSISKHSSLGCNCNYIRLHL